MRGPLLLVLPALALAATLAPADDWPQWMGPTRDAVWHETGIIAEFPKAGLKKAWSAKIHGGYSGPAVAAGKVYVCDWIPDKDAKRPDGPFDAETGVAGTERVLCFDAATGTEVWKREDPRTYKVSFNSGPRCTPTIADGKVYSLGTMGELLCLDAAKGTLVWQTDFKKDYKSKPPTWGYCGHPLVYKNLLVCLVGGPDALVVAFDKDTGKEVWKALSPKTAGVMGYAPPTILKVGDSEQLVQFHPTGITGLDPLTGVPKWTVKLVQPQYGMSIMAPRPSGDHLFAGGEEAAIAMKLTPDKAGYEADWQADAKAKGFMPVNMTPFVEGDTIYGVDKAGMLRAVDIRTGKRLWYAFEPVIGQWEPETFKGAGSATAFLVKNGDRFFCFNEKGDLVIAKLTPQKYTEISSTHLIEPTGTAWGRKVVWTHPAFANKSIYVRNDKELVCFSLAK